MNKIPHIILSILCLFGQVYAQPAGMKKVEAGTYKPLYVSKNEAKEKKVEAFYMDAYPVTNAQFAEFVKRNPEWSRSRVKRIFADDGYLRNWKADFEAGEGVQNNPVTHVSWFAARAYCKWKGGRLPDLAEWEYAASADMDAPKVKDEKQFNQRILDWYAKPSSDQPAQVGSTFANYWGIYDLHGLIWEWVDDFSSALVTGESRGDGAIERNLFCGSGAVGSSDFRDYAAFMRYGYRSSLKAAYTVKNLGFRCVKNIEK